MLHLKIEYRSALRLRFSVSLIVDRLVVEVVMLLMASDDVYIGSALELRTQDFEMLRGLVHFQYVRSRCTSLKQVHSSEWCSLVLSEDDRLPDGDGNGGVVEVG